MHINPITDFIHYAQTMSVQIIAADTLIVMKISTVQQFYRNDFHFWIVYFHLGHYM